METPPRKYIGKSDFEIALLDLGHKLSESESPTEALLLISQIEALLKEMKIWVNKYQSDEMNWKKTEARMADLRTRGPKASLKIEGDAISILQRAKQAADKAGWTKEQWDAYVKKALVGNYSNLDSKDFSNFISVTLDYFEWEKGKEFG